MVASAQTPRDMPKITVFPLGNADTSRIDLDNGKKILIDYANARPPGGPSDPGFDLPGALRRDLGQAGRNYYDVVAFTHLDDDHITGASEFFHFRHAQHHLRTDRIRIQELWVPAAVILETGLEGEKRIIQQEAKYRLRHGHGIRVFSSPRLLDHWLSQNGIWTEHHSQLISDAGTKVPGFTLLQDGAEFFVHSPFATRSKQGELLDRNRDSLAFQVTFLAGGRTTRALFLADLTYDVIADIVRVTERHGNNCRLSWGVLKISHHCSYTALGPEKGTDMTKPDPTVDRLFSKYGQRRAIAISTSDPIPIVDEEQPPHRQAAAYYSKIAKAKGGKFAVTMDHPTKAHPAPLEIRIDSQGATLVQAAVFGGIHALSTPAPRAG